MRSFKHRKLSRELLVSGVKFLSFKMNKEKEELPSMHFLISLLVQFITTTFTCTSLRQLTTRHQELWPRPYVRLL